MNADGIASRTRGRLPSIPDYLRAVWDLGRRSLRPALPALAFMYFYRVGIGVYTALSRDTVVAGTGPAAEMVPMLATAATFVPLLLLIYVPFLPLQDELLRGRVIGFMASIRRTFETSWKLTVSGLLQGIFLFAPFVVLMAVVGILARGLEESDPRRMAALLIAIALGAVWFMIGSLLMMFATPAVVLDDEPPVRSVGTSIRLATTHLPGLLARLIAFGLLEVVAYVVLAMPASMLTGLQHAADLTSSPLKIAAAIWSSAVQTAIFPFSVAALMVLYRSTVPSAEAARAGVPVAADEDLGPAIAMRAPFE